MDDSMLSRVAAADDRSAASVAFESTTSLLHSACMLQRLREEEKVARKGGLLRGRIQERQSQRVKPKHKSCQPLL